MHPVDQIIADIRAAGTIARIGEIYAYASVAFASDPGALQAISAACADRDTYLQQQPNMFDAPRHDAPAPSQQLPPPPQTFHANATQDALAATAAVLPPSQNRPAFDPMIDLKCVMLAFASAAHDVGCGGMAEIISVRRLEEASPDNLWTMAMQLLETVRAHVKHLAQQQPRR